jgi:hypothetical protein
VAFRFLKRAVCISKARIIKEVNRMDDMSFNIGSLSNPKQVGRKTNELDTKEKEKRYEKSNLKKKKKNLFVKSRDFENLDEDLKTEDTKKKVVDIFI